MGTTKLKMIMASIQAQKGANTTSNMDKAQGPDKSQQGVASCLFKARVASKGPWVWSNLLGTRNPSSTFGWHIQSEQHACANGDQCLIANSH
eukprot:4902679-Amphidinium_carterae.2